jgi:formimidoylglutamate deiminase
MTAALTAPRLFTGTRWIAPAVIEIENGIVTALREGSDGDPLGGTVIPGMPNVHSHAFQRLLVGRTEATRGADTFWSWRETMYRVAQALDPAMVHAAAFLLYVEMLENGTTSVGEFHYLHHDRSGAPYADVGEMAAHIAGAATDAGIGLTLLPVLYQTSDFDRAPLPEQRRFLCDTDTYLRLVSRCAELARVGIAPHSLRAVPPAALADVLAAFPHGPVHIHVAEQEREVESSLAARGARPVTWLLDHAAVDERWCLVHATHLDDTEVRGIAASRATVGLCPTTEADLGDGLFPLSAFLSDGGAFGIGSDSQVSVAPGEELRLLEVGQRLLRRTRNGSVQGHLGEALFSRAITGGAQALGIRGGLEVGAPADFVVLDDGDPRLVGHGTDTLLDALVFGTSRFPIREVRVGGRTVVKDGRHVARDRARTLYRQTVEELFS